MVSYFLSFLAAHLTHIVSTSNSTSLNITLLLCFGVCCLYQTAIILESCQRIIRQFTNFPKIHLRNSKALWSKKHPYISVSEYWRNWSILELAKPFFTYNVAVMGLGHKQHPANQICSGHSLGAFTFPATRQDSDKMGILLSTIHNVSKVLPSKSFCLP